MVLGSGRRRRRTDSPGAGGQKVHHRLCAAVPVGRRPAFIEAAALIAIIHRRRLGGAVLQPEALGDRHLL
jgi:hypothetical protein